MTQIIMQGQSLIHIDGYDRIINFDTEAISLKCKDKILTVRGRGLRIDSFDSAKMQISGEFIYAAEWSQIPFEVALAARLRYRHPNGLSQI